MKRLLLSLITLIFFSATAIAGTVNITYASDSLNYSPCQLPQHVMFMVNGNTTGYSQGDTLDVYIAFGDGNDTTTNTTLWGASGNFWGWSQHQYTMPGLYTVMYVVTAPDGASDTLVVANEVILGTTCDNVDGQVFIDNDADCSFSSGDQAYPYMGVKLMLGNQVVQQTYTDTNGNYSLTAVSGFNYDVVLGNTSLSIACPSGGSHAVGSLPANNLDFALQCPSSQVDIEARYLGNFIVPGVTRTILFNVRNKLCTPASGVAALTLSSSVTYVPTSGSYYATPDSINGNTLYFSYNNLTVLSDMDINVRLKGDTTLTVSDSVCVSLATSVGSNDVDASNNVIGPCLEVRTSYDPNMKTVYPAGESSEGYIRADQNMLYTIHFQNTGNFMATNIFILDTIDTQVLDLNSLEIVDFSHPMELRMLDNGVLRFNFNNIMLPDSNSNEPESHGYVSFTIDQAASLAHGTKIENTAGIFFDYNPPIITNTALNTIDLFISIEEPADAALADMFSAYPNPSTGTVWIEINNNVGKAALSIFDLNGKKVLSQSVNGRELVNLAHLAKGVYILQVTDGDSSQQRRMIIE